MYRMSYGNGQVSGTFETYAQAHDAYRMQVYFDRRMGQSSGSLRIQRYEGDGEWFRCSEGRDRPEVL